MANENHVILFEHLNKHKDRRQILMTEGTIKLSHSLRLRNRDRCHKSPTDSPFCVSQSRMSRRQTIPSDKFTQVRENRYKTAVIRKCIVLNARSCAGTTLGVAHYECNTYVKEDLI